jgi:hypothetical protein
MKKIYSTMMILMVVTMMAITGLAGGQSGKPEKREPKENEEQRIPLQCTTVFQSKTSPTSLNEPTSWFFHGYITNKTGQVIPKGARIEISFSSSKPGYFQTNSGGVPVLRKVMMLQQALGVNGQLFVGGLTFVTTNNPAQITGHAEWVKWR